MGEEGGVGGGDDGEGVGHVVCGGLASPGTAFGVGGAGDWVEG